MKTANLIKKINIHSGDIIAVLFSAAFFAPAFFSGGREPFFLEASRLAMGLIILADWKFSETRIKISRPFKIAFLFWLAFLAAGFVSSIFSVSLFRSFSGWSDYFFYAGILAYGYFFFSAERRQAGFFYSVFGVSAALSVFGLYFFITGSYDRLTSLFYWPNPFASFLLMGLPVSAAVFLGSSKKLFIGPFLILILTAFFLTFSRGAALCLIAAGLLYFAVRLMADRKAFFKAIRANIVALALVLFFSLALFYFFTSLKGNHQTFLNRSWANDKAADIDFSTQGRLRNYQGALKIWQAAPFLGSGPATFGAVYPAYLESPTDFSAYAHNLYLETLAETGAVGVIFFLLFFLAIFRSGLRILSRGSGSYAEALFFGLAAFSFHNFLDIGWNFPANLNLFFFLVGLLYCFDSPETENENLIPSDEKIIENKSRVGAGFFIGFILTAGLFIIIKSGFSLAGQIAFDAGETFLARKDYGPATVSYCQAARLYPNPQYYGRLGLAGYLEGIELTDGSKQFGDALIALDRAVKLDRINPAYYELAGQILERQGDLVQAEEKYRETARLAGIGVPRYHIGLAALLIKVGRGAEAEEMIKALLSHYPEEIVRNREMIIFGGQSVKSSIEKDVGYLKSMLSYLESLKL